MVYKSSFYRLLLILINSILFLFVCTLHGQSLSETWSVPGYQSSDYSEFYGNVYFANSMEEWDYRVEEVLSFSMNQWIENADRMVELMLLEENEEDHFVSNEGYIDERRRSLYSEVVVLYSEWERQLTEDYFENRNAFLHKLETGKVDALYLQRIGQESLYAEYTEEERNLTENRNRILESAREWELEWGQTRQDGLDSFANSFSQLQTDYENYIRSLEETEDQFSNHLNAINSYKNTVKAALHEVVSQLKVGLDSSCSITTGCQYKNFDGSYNEAGKIFSRFIGDLSEELNQPNIDPDSILTSISTRIRDFLSNESNQAFSEYQLHQKRIYTYQTGFQIDLSQSTSAFDLVSAEWRLRNQTYYDLTNDMRYENWLSGNIGEVGAFSNVYDLEMQGILQSIHNGDYGRLTSIINGKLGDGRRVQSLVSANLYTDAFHFINNQKIGDFYIPFEEAHHTHGNLLLDGHQKYGYWKADRYFTVFTPGSHSFQMGAIGYSVLYEMFDENSSKTSLYWKDNSSQLGGQYNHFQNTLLPAVSHWESKVKEYANTYEGWKENRSNLIAEANAKLEANRQELERSKEEWLQRLEEEKRNGWKSWADLYEAGETKNISTPSLSTWTPSKNLEVFDETKGLEFQSLARFEGSTNGIQIGENGPGLLEEFQRTITGVGQYASVIQMNDDLEKVKRTEQQKLINQMTYEMNSESLGGRKLTKEEMIILGTYDSSQLTQEEQSRFGSCYENPEANICKTLLKKAYEVTMDSNNGVLTLKKEIHNGLLAGKNADGQYNAGKTEEVRHIQMSSIGKVSASNGKDFFTVWNEEDWENLYEKKEEVARSFLSNSLQKDKKALHSNLTSIHEKDNRNQELFLARKESQENNDSLVQELAIAYLTGGAAGMRASLTGKLESAINGELAKAWIQATGGRESDIQMATMAIDFMRGRMSAKKIQSRDQFVSIKNPIQAFESIAAKTISSSFSMLDQISFGVTTVSLNAAMSASVGITKKIVGERQYNNINEQIAGSGKRLQEIKANEQMLVQNGISMAISKGTGIPTDVISKFLGDKYGQTKAKQANKAMAKNPIYDMGSQMIGAFGGMVKTATVALGVTEDEIQSIMEDTNGILHAGNKNINSSTTESFGYTLQAFGMQAGWTKYQSTYLNLRDSKAVVEELGKKALAKELAKSMGMDENGVRQIVDSTYSSQQKQKSDKKAKSNAVRQTVVNAASLAITFGASGALSGMSSVLTKIGKAVSTMTTGILPATTQVGQAVASTFVQTMAGSHEGPKGAMAGFANGVIGGVTQGIGKIQSGVFKGMVPGIGVTYSEQNGWGGSLGIGNAVSNMSVSFSEKGNTTLQASKSLGGGVQLAADVTTNGAANLGFNYNPTGKGPRSDWNFSMMYDLNGSGLSGSIGYTDPKSKLGLTSSIDRNGISTSSELQGVTLGTNSDDGFQIQDMNFAEQNINAAQDAGDTGDGGNQSADKDSPNQDADLFRDFADAGLAFAGLIVGGATLAAGLFSRGSQTTPTRGAARPGESVVFERDRRREDEGRNNSENLDRDDALNNVLGTVSRINLLPAVGVSPSQEVSGTGPVGRNTNPHKGGVGQGDGVLMKNPQSSNLIKGYNESIVSTLRNVVNNREKIIENATNNKKILSSEEGIKLKQEEANAKTALGSVKKTKDSVNQIYREAVSNFTAYAESYGKMVTERMLDAKTAEKLIKEKYDMFVKPAKEILDSTTKSIKTLTIKAESDLSEATKNTDKFIQSQKKIIAEGIGKSKIIEAAKQLSKLDSPDIDPKLKTAYDKLEKAEKNLNDTNSEPGSQEYKKIWDTYLKEKNNFLMSEVGRDIGKQIELANAPDVYKGQTYKPIPDTIPIKDTQYKVEASERLKIKELRASLESREIQNPEEKAKVDGLKKKYEIEVAAFANNSKVSEANKKIEALNVQIQNKKAEFDVNQTPAKDKERIKFESEMKMKIDAQRKIISDSQKDMFKAEKSFKAERMTALIKEDPNLLGIVKPNSLDSTNRKDTIYDLFYGKDDRDISSAANSLFDGKVKLGESSPLASKVITDQSIPTNSGMLPPGAGYVRYMDFYGKQLILPGVPGSPITSDFGFREDPKTGDPAMHLGTDNRVARGSVIGFPVGGKVVAVNKSDIAGENSRHTQGLGKSVTIQVGNEVQITVGHNGSILVNRDQEITPGQAISVSSNSGRSIGNPGDHTHVEFSFYEKDPKTGIMGFKDRVPTARDIPLLKKLGLIK